MFKLIAISILLIISTNSRSFSQIHDRYDTLYVIIQLDSDKYRVDMSVSSQFRITTSKSKQWYQDFMKKRSESRYLIESSADFDATPFYIFHCLSYADTILTKQEYSIFKNDNSNKIIDFLTFEDFFKNGFRVGQQIIFIINKGDEKYYFYTIYYLIS